MDNPNDRINKVLCWFRKFTYKASQKNKLHVLDNWIKICNIENDQRLAKALIEEKHTIKRSGIIFQTKCKIKRVMIKSIRPFFNIN